MEAANFCVSAIDCCAYSVAAQYIDDPLHEWVGLDRMMLILNHFIQIIVRYVALYIVIVQVSILYKYGRRLPPGVP